MNLEGFEYDKTIDGLILGAARRMYQLDLIVKERECWMDVKEAAEFASVSETTIWRGVEKGELKVSRKTGKLLFRRYWINNWLKDVKS